jgi:hypothetical protein
MHETKSTRHRGLSPVDECKDSVINVYIFRFPQLGKLLGKDWEEKERIGKRGSGWENSIGFMVKSNAKTIFIRICLLIQILFVHLQH